MAAAASSSAMESRPPDSATRTFAPRKPCAASAAAIAARGGTSAPASAGRDLLVPSIGEELVLARLEQRVDGLLVQLAQGLGERLLQRDHHRGVVAMRAAERLVHHLVH